MLVTVQEQRLEWRTGDTLPTYATRSPFSILRSTGRCLPVRSKFGRTTIGLRSPVGIYKGYRCRLQGRKNGRHQLRPASMPAESLQALHGQSGGQSCAGGCAGVGGLVSDVHEQGSGKEADIKLKQWIGQSELELQISPRLGNARVSCSDCNPFELSPFLSAALWTENCRQ